MDILRHKTDTLRQLLHRASKGYTRWTGGQVAPVKAEALVLKFQDRYLVTQTDMQRWRAKKAGQARATLTLYPIEIPDQPILIHWWLQVSQDGEGLVTQLETLADCTDKRHRIVWPYEDYELVKLPRKKTERTQGASKLNPAWTWRMLPERSELWRDELRRAIRTHDDTRLRQILWSLRRAPQFRGVRTEVMSILRKGEAEWKRASRTEPWPGGPNTTAFVGRRKAGGAASVSLTDVVKRLKKGLSPFQKPATKPEKQKDPEPTE